MFLFLCLIYLFVIVFSTGIAGGTVTTFLPLVVYLIMTLVMCPSILAGSNFKSENDAYAANLERMFHLNDEKSVSVSIRKTYTNHHDDDILDEKSNNSVKSFHSYKSAKDELK